MYERNIVNWVSNDTNTLQLGIQILIWRGQSKVNSNSFCGFLVSWPQISSITYLDLVNCVNSLHEFQRMVQRDQSDWWYQACTIIFACLSLTPKLNVKLTMKSKKAYLGTSNAGVPQYQSADDQVPAQIKVLSCKASTKYPAGASCLKTVPMAPAAAAKAAKFIILQGKIGVKLLPPHINTLTAAMYSSCNPFSNLSKCNSTSFLITVFTVCKVVYIDMLKDTKVQATICIYLKSSCFIMTYHDYRVIIRVVQSSCFSATFQITFWPLFVILAEEDIKVNSKTGQKVAEKGYFETPGFKTPEKGDKKYTFYFYHRLLGTWQEFASALA